MKEYYTRYIKYLDGRIEEVKVPKDEVIKQIRESVERDKELLDILEKL